jgi:hypothetical protein
MTTTAPATPPSTARQISGYGANGEFILSVIVKRTYRLLPDGRCVLAPEQLPLVEEPVFDPELPGVMLEDMDLYAYKPLSDVVVDGHAYAEKPSGAFSAGLSVGKVMKKLALFGPRRCEPTRTGLRFSRAEPVAKVALSSKHAYGGHDTAAEAKHGNHLAELAQYLGEMDLRLASPYVYPRNPAGTGFVIDGATEALEKLSLPLIEDPDDLLTPARLVCGAPARWAAMPLPWSPGWMDIAVFPRSAYFGAVPEIDPETLPLPEVRREFIPSTLVRGGRLFESFDPRAANGASFGLQIPYLKPGTDIVLIGLHPTARKLQFRLPEEQPRLWIDGRNGKLVTTEPVLHTLRLLPDRGLFTVTWCGSGPALRPYLPEELEKMPFKVAW